MYFKTPLLVFLLLASISAFAQDKIYLRDGSVIDGKVKTISIKTVTYKRADNADGPDHTIAKAGVSTIVYANGTTDVFNVPVKGMRRHGKMWNDDDGKSAKYGNNILSVIPGAYTADLNGIMSDPGIGISYERLLDERGHIGFTLPILVNFLSDRDFNSYNYTYNPYNPNPPYAVSAAGYTSLSVMPGIKLYPAPKSHAIRYSLGASFFTMFGKQPFYVYDYNSTSTADYNYSVYGFMVTNSLNVSATKHFCMSLDFNGAIPVSDNRRANRNEFDQFLAPTIQFVLKVGYRF